METNLKAKATYALKASIKLKDLWKPLALIILGLVSEYRSKGLNMLPELEGNFLFIAVPVIGYYLILFLYKFFSAPLALQNQSLLEGRDLTHKITDGDLQRLLRGYIFDNVFHYNAENVYHFKEYKDQFSIQLLRDNYDPLIIRCPSNATAHLTLSFMNGHKNIDKTGFICIKDGHDKEHKINIREIYEEFEFFVGENSTIYIKLQYPDDYEICEHANLRISLQAWEI